VIHTDSFNEEKAVAKLSEVIALAYGAAPDEARRVRAASALHDVGKQKIPSAILNKPGKLTAEEFEIVKTHTTLGAEILAGFQGKLGEMARLTALYHHERWDGGGYWGKLAGELPYYVAVTSIADGFTALVCERAYKRPWPPNEAIAYIWDQSGAHFSPALVEVFLPLARNDARVRAIFEGVE
jgi:response regulator RpfG family c-di-GMP phosphodiesterase